MVRWRFPAAILVALLLPVPIMAILSIHWVAPRSTPEGKAVVPMLSLEDRLQRSTWRQPCLRSSDCEPPLACFLDRYGQNLYCTDSDCMTDTQCREDFTCRSMATLGGEILKRCAVKGNRREGEECEPLSKTYSSACAAGLLCDDWCGSPCEPDDPESCPEGFFCPVKGGPAGHSCLPTCESRGCPAGQECIHFHHGVSVCSVVQGTNCQQSSCSEGRICKTHTLPRRPGVVWMRCEFPCSNEGPSCPQGFFCRLGRCLRTCEAGVEGVCGPDEKCARLKDGEHQACIFDKGD